MGNIVCGSLYRLGGTCTSSEKKELSKKPHTNIAVQFKVEREFEALILSQLFEKVVFSKCGQGDKKLLTVMNLSEQGKKLGNELFTRSNSVTLEHFYCNNKIPQEETVDELINYKYEQCDSKEIAVALKSRLDNDWLMQYLLQTPGVVLEATHLTQEELDEDLFVQYISNHVKELYLSVDPKLYSNVENPMDIKNRKQLFWR